MRTSRVSRETAHLVEALSPSRTRATRRSLRGFANPGAPVNQHEPNGSDSELSTPPWSPKESPVSSLGKRKRGSRRATPRATESNPSRRSTRKPSKPDDATTARKPRRQPAKRIQGPNGAHTAQPPPNWQRMYDVTATMRQRLLAPVDTMGCESLAEETRSPRDQRLQTLVALMLSSQTKDTVTAVAIKNLQEGLPGGFCLEALLEVEAEVLNEMIGKVGFHNNKTKYIKAVAPILRDAHGGDIPESIEGLIALPGVGPKMAYLCMSAAWGKTEGIGVDVHVHRITNLWGWHKTSTPEETRGELESWLPREKWHHINHMLVGLGQTVCLPVGRRCGDCDLAKEKLCPSEVAGSPTKRRVKREVEIKVEDGEVVKKEEIKTEKDDVGVKIEADLESEGKVSVQAFSEAKLEDAGTSEEVRRSSRRPAREVG